MKTFLVAVLASLPLGVFADTTSPSTVLNPLPPQPTQELAVMTERLHLSQGQQDKIAPILVSEADQRKSIESNTTLNAQEKHDQIGVVHRAALQQIKKVFTPEQIALIEQGQNHPSPGTTHP